MSARVRKRLALNNEQPKPFRRTQDSRRDPRQRRAMLLADLRLMRLALDEAPEPRCASHMGENVLLQSAKCPVNLKAMQRKERIVSVLDV